MISNPTGSHFNSTTLVLQHTIQAGSASALPWGPPKNPAMLGFFLTGLFFFLLSLSLLLLQIRDALGRALEVKSDLEGRLDRKNHVVQELLARIDKLEQLVEGGAGKATSSAPQVSTRDAQVAGERWALRHIHVMIGACALWWGPRAFFFH